MIELRQQARRNRDWAEADRLRDELLEHFTEPTYEIDSEVHVPIPGQDPIKKTGQELKRFDIPPYRSSILFCEDVINTGRSTYEMMDAVHKARGTAQGTLPYVLCLVNRSGRTALNGIDGRGELEIISLADVTAKTWGKLEDAVDDICPVTSHAECRNSDCEYREVKGTDVACGMEAVRPKDNWEKLTAEDKE
ncbi:MAG TPA: hypothetical protein ENH11_00460 [Candidatus Acetothermia bacterium]|nr:hypothetical protein [Candidatus Acetothermia bacterium]